jgi:branched-chain amino acid transport system ATP-binding protein
VLLKVENLIVHYGNVEAVRSVSMEVEEHTIACLIGGNGAGKTTILRTLSGLQKLTSGEIWLKDERIDGLPSQDIVRRGIIHVPEGRRVFPFMSVYDNLRLGSYQLKDRGQIKKNLELVYYHLPRLKERMRQKAGSLSGGEQQMLAMGRALMASPRLLLLDEPSMGLSPILVEEIAKIITNIRNEGVTIVLVEQNAFLALDISTKGYVLETGRVALEGDSQRLLQDEHVKKAYLGG